MEQNISLTKLSATEWKKKSNKKQIIWTENTLIETIYLNTKYICKTTVINSCYL